MNTGAEQRTSFRKPGCGIEGKWKGGPERVLAVPEFPRFPHTAGKRVWNSGFAAWKAWIEAVKMRA
jgi:hypothetical protein